MTSQEKKLQMPDAAMTKKIVHNQGITKKIMPDAGMLKKVMPGAGMTKKIATDGIAMAVRKMTEKISNGNDNMAEKVFMIKEALIRGKARERAVSGKSYMRGVSPKLQKKKVPLGGDLSAGSGTGSFPNFKYNGGPIVNTPQVYNIFLGDWSSVANQNRADRLNQFIVDLMNSQYMNILSQYGCGSTGNLINSVFIPSTDNDLSHADIVSIIQNAINNSTIPEPINRSNVYNVFLDDNTAVNDTVTGAVMCEATSDTAFGYHDFFTTTAGNNLYFAIIPALTDSCLRNSCPGNDGGCSLHLAQTREQRQTQVLSHEFSEMISDPEVGSNEGWTQPSGPHENGDICNGQTRTITVGPNTWTVQLMYSKYDDMQSNGATTCIAGAPNPLPSLLPTPNPAWSGWFSLGGWIDMLTVGQNEDGRLEVFARGADGAVWHNWQTTPNGNWSGWDSLGGWIDMLAVGKNQDGRLEIFARGGDGAIWHNWQTTPNGNWSGWDSLGGWIDMLAIGQNQDGRLEIFARGGDGGAWHNWQTTPNGNWSGWESLGGWIDRLAIGQNQDGRLEIFARGGDGGVWHNWQTTPNGNWSGWDSLGGWIDILTVGKNQDGRLEIFARGGDGAVWHNWQTAPNNGWSGWDSMGGWIDMLSVGQNQDMRLEIFARGGDGAVWHNWQTAPNNGWSGWDSLGGWIDRLAVGQNADGRLEIFARGGDAALWHNWQTAPNF